MSALSTEPESVASAGFAAAPAMEHVRSRLASGKAEGCGRDVAALWDASGTAAPPEPAATPANTAAVPSSRNATASAEASQALGCLRISLQMPPERASSRAAPSRIARRVSAWVGGTSGESVTTP